VIHATGDRSDPIEQARYMEARLPRATMVELDSRDHLIWLSDAREQLIAAVV
jgi:pimeloyl-ACP methyl ester carboxylesterase